MSKTSADRIALMLAQLPEVKDLIARQESSEREQAVAARLDCLERLKEHRAKEDESKTAHQEAAKKLDELRTKLHEVERVAFAAYANWTQAAGARNHIENELSQVHGECVVKQAAYVLHRAKEDTEKLLNNLESNRYIHTNFGTRVERPEVVQRIAEVQENLGAITLAAESIEALHEAEIAPYDIQNQVDGILASAKCRPVKTDIDPDSRILE